MGVKRGVESGCREGKKFYRHLHSTSWDFFMMSTFLDVVEIIYLRCHTYYIAFTTDLGGGRLATSDMMIVA